MPGVTGPQRPGSELRRWAKPVSSFRETFPTLVGFVGGAALGARLSLGILRATRPAIDPGTLRFMASTVRLHTICLVIIATVLVGWVLHVGAAILQPLVIAALLANVLQPLVRLLAKLRVPAPVTIVILSVLLFWSFFRIGSLLQDNISVLLGEVPVPAEEEGGVVTSWNRVVTGLTDVIDRQRLLSEEAKRALHRGVREFDVQAAVAGLIGTGITFTRSLVVVLIYMIFLFAEKSVFQEKVKYIAGSRGATAMETVGQISQNVQRYLSVKTLVSLATGVVCYWLLVATRVPFALLFALLTFALNYVPTFGSIIAGLLATLTALAVHESYVPAAFVASGYAGVNVVFGTFLEPRILSRELNLSPLVIIISVVVWAQLWGAPGAFLAVPLTSALQIVLASGRGRPVAVILSGRLPREDTSAA